MAFYAVFRFNISIVQMLLKQVRLYWLPFTRFTGAVKSRTPQLVLMNAGSSPVGDTKIVGYRHDYGHGNPQFV
jgi:hypothetical protein